MIRAFYEVTWRLKTERFTMNFDQSAHDHDDTWLTAEDQSFSLEPLPRDASPASTVGTVGTAGTVGGSFATVGTAGSFG